MDATVRVGFNGYILYVQTSRHKSINYKIWNKLICILIIFWHCCKYIYNYDSKNGKVYNKIFEQNENTNLLIS